MDDERLSPRSEVVVASADTGTRPVPARASVMDAAEVLLEYASVGRTDNDRESAQWSSARQTGAIELGDRGRLQIDAQRGAVFGGVNITEEADRRNNSITDDGTAGATELPMYDVAAGRGWNQWSTDDLLSPDRSHTETGVAIGEARIKSSRTSWNAGHLGVSDRDLDYFVLERQRREFEFKKLGSGSNLRNGSSKWKKNDGARKRISDELQRMSGSISRSSGVGWTKNDRARR